MKTNLFTGTLVRLAAANAETDVETVTRFSQDSEYLRLMDSVPARPRSATSVKEGMEKEPEDNLFFFHIRALNDDQLLGSIDVEVNCWPHGDAWIGIDIGERKNWGKGYGTDAMQVMLRYAFTELNLHRVSLNVFEYNTRAIRLYEKTGFRVEGRVRQFLHRDGRRWDLIYMGLLREEWLSSDRLVGDHESPLTAH